MSTHNQSTLGSFRLLPAKGPLKVEKLAEKEHGFVKGDPEWLNLGQGAPELGELPDGGTRFTALHMRSSDLGYGPYSGIPELKQAIAGYYNRQFRVGMAEQYTAANVSVGAGSRVLLARVLDALKAPLNLGYQVPGYPAYEHLMADHSARGVVPVMLSMPESKGFRMSAASFRKRARDRRLGAALLCNPHNPTGQVIAADELRAYVAAAVEDRITLIFDEVYSLYTYDGCGPVSAAAMVEHINSTPVLLLDGLTKGLRYPGYRVGWVVGPAAMIEQLAVVASHLDGGATIGMQRLAVDILAAANVDAEVAALRSVFSHKRQLMCERLRQMGFVLAPVQGTFYVWASVAKLPPPLNHVERFLRAVLSKKVLLVPGQLFDICPGDDEPSACWPSLSANYVRMSFGPELSKLMEALDRLQVVITEAATSEFATTAVCPT